MTFIIQPNETIQTIQSHFMSLFSHLKPEFFKTPHHLHEANSNEEAYLHNIPLREITGKNEPMEMNLEPSMKTSELETMFEKEFHLHVQLMRKQHGVWLQTTRTDELSLFEQNQHGIESDVIIKQQLPAEYDEQ